ncbi:MAG: hypothetical protein JW751_00205 [Polyangiaceae bacterium]|nr:hypothetical protein [Polyangiaceae bacterium]
MMTRWSVALASCVLLAPACSSTTHTAPNEEGCTPGDFRCHGDELQRCDSDGEAWEVRTRCVPGSCVDGQDSCPARTSENNGGGAGLANGGGRNEGGSADSGAGGRSTNGGVGSGGRPSEGGTSANGGVPGWGGRSDYGGVAGQGGLDGSGGQPGGSGGTGGSSGGSGGTGGSSGGSGGTGGSSGTGGQSPFCTPNPCSTGYRCDEPTRSCICTGCLIGQRCVANGTPSTENPCEVCNPTVSPDSYSANVGASCGSGPTECTGQDTCNDAAVCRSNPVADGTECVDGFCEAGLCRMPVFDCIAPDPPPANAPDDRFLASGDPPAPRGGTVQSGRYTPVRIDIYGDTPETFTILTFEFQGIFVQVGSQPHPQWIPQIEFAGIVTTAENSLVFDLERCDPQYDIDAPTVEYTATASGLLVFQDYSDSSRTVTSYLRD